MTALGAPPPPSTEGAGWDAVGEENSGSFQPQRRGGKEGGMGCFSQQD